MNEYLEEQPPTYIKVNYKGKKREMRRFGACNLLDSAGKVIRPLKEPEYMYVYRDGKRIHFGKTPNRPTKKVHSDDKP